MNKPDILNLPPVHSVEEAFSMLQRVAGIASLTAIADGRIELASWATEVSRTARSIVKDEADAGQPLEGLEEK